MDSKGHPFAIRGTELPPEGWTATALVTIRQRLSMNTVRIPAAGQDWASVERVIRVANRLELLAIVEADDAPPDIRDNPDRRCSWAGRSSRRSRRGTATPGRGSCQRDRCWSTVDPELDRDSPECRSFPPDPGVAERFLREKLRFFEHWTISSFRPGRLITDYRYFVGTKLGHLWNSDPHGLFAVNGDSGGYGYRSAAARRSTGRRLPTPSTRLGGDRCRRGSATCRCE